MSVQYNQRSGGRGIEWCDETRNVTGGCKHRCRWEMPDGTIAVCYAEDLAENGVAKKAYPNGFEHHYWRPDALRQLSAGDEPLLIFGDSMSDMFAANVPEGHVRAILAEMRKAPHHTYQSLTKAAPQLLQYLPDLPPNLWVGCNSPPDWFMGRRMSHDQQKSMLRRSLAVLREVKEKTGNIVWMSAEPISWDLTSVIDDEHPLDWIVIGAASDGRRYFQPEPGHVHKLLTVMDATSTPVFYKGNIRATFKWNDFGSSTLNRWREDFPLIYRSGNPIPAVVRRQSRCEIHGWTKSAGVAPTHAS